MARLGILTGRLLHSDDSEEIPLSVLTARIMEAETMRFIAPWLLLPGYALVLCISARQIPQWFCGRFMLWAQFSVQLFTQILNPARLVYYGIYEDDVLPPANQALHRFAPIAAIFVWDIFIIAVVFALMGYFFTVQSVLSKHNWILPAQACAVAFVNCHFFTPTISNSILVDYLIRYAHSFFVGGFGYALWLNRYYIEKTWRKHWAHLCQQKEESSMLERLLQLTYPAVVRVRGLVERFDIEPS